MDFGRFSSYLRLQRTVTWMLRFINRCRKKFSPEERNGLTAADLKTAEIYLCRQIREEKFNAEIKILKSERSLAKSSELFAWAPYLDES